MEKVRGLLIGAVVVLLVGSALVLRTAGPGRSDDSATTTDPAAQSTTPEGAPSTGDAASGAPTTPSTGVPPAQATPSTPSGTATTVPPASDQYQFEATLSPLCVTTGAPLTVTLHLQPGNGASIIAAYSDGGTHGSRYQGYAGPDGKLTRTWPAAVVTGPANLLVSATDNTGRSGGKRIEFEVVEAGKSC